MVFAFMRQYDLVLTNFLITHAPEDFQKKYGLGVPKAIILTNFHFNKMFALL